MTSKKAQQQMISKRITLLILLLILCGCDVHYYLSAAEIEKRAKTCDKNDGVKSFGVHEVDDITDDGIIIKIICNDGAVFTIPRQQWNN